MKTTLHPVQYVPPFKEQETFSEIIKRMEEELALNCFICSHTFNTSNRAPTIVCRRQHTYCAECIPLIQRARPNRCPECRFKIYDENIFINRPLFAISHFFPQLKAGVDALARQNQRLTFQVSRLTLTLEEMSRNFERQIEHARKTIKQEGLTLQQIQQKLYLLAKEKVREKAVSDPKIKPEQSTLLKTGEKRLNPEQKQKKGMSNLKIKRKYTKGTASTSKRKQQNFNQLFNLRIHSYHMQT